MTNLFYVKRLGNSYVSDNVSKTILLLDRTNIITKQNLIDQVLDNEIRIFSVLTEYGIMSKQEFLKQLGYVE